MCWLLVDLALQYSLSNRCNKKCPVAPPGCRGTSHPTSHTSTHRCSQAHSYRDGVSAGSPVTTANAPSASTQKKGQEVSDGGMTPHISMEIYFSIGCACAGPYKDVRRLNRTSEKMQMLSGYFSPKPIYNQYSYL